MTDVASEEAVAWHVYAPNTIMPEPRVFQVEIEADAYLAECLNEHRRDFVKVPLYPRSPTGGREAELEASVRRFIKNIPSIVEDHVCGGSDTRPVVDVDGLVGGLTENAAALLPSQQKARS